MTENGLWSWSTSKKETDKKDVSDSRKSEVLDGIFYKTEVAGRSVSVVYW